MDLSVFMPNRILRASLRQSLRWNQCTPLAQSFYIRLLTLVDDYGRYEAHHQLLANECFPYGDSQGNPVSRAAVENLLQIICNANLVVCYRVDGNQYLQLTRWKEHVRTQSKFPECPKELMLCKCTANAQQMITSPPSPSSAPSPSPAPSVLTLSGLEVEPSKQPTTETDWLNLLQKSEGYRDLDVTEQYSRCGIWCQSHGKHLTRRRFIAWLNKADKPISVNGNGNGHISGAKIIALNDELVRIYKKMDKIRGQYSDHQAWDQRDKDRFSQLVKRKNEVNELIGVKE